MNPVKGILNPARYFRCVARKDSKTLVDEMLKRIIFITSFFAIIAYFSVSGFAEKIDLDGHSVLALKAAIDSGVWAFSTFALHGLIAAVIAKLFSVDERVSVISTCYFWSQLYGWLVGFFAMTLTFCIVFFITSDVEFSFMLSILPFVIVKVWYLMKGTEISMQTSKLESITIIILSGTLLLSISWCLNKSTDYYFSKEMLDVTGSTTILK